MKIIDVSRTLNPSIAVWPGDSPFAKRSVLKIADGASVNLTTLTVSAHTGTHVDAPYHFVESGATLEAVDLSAYWGLAQVVTVDKVGALVSADFAAYDLTLAPRLLVRTPAQNVPHDVFSHDIAYPSPQLADWLGSLGIVLYGTDAPSMDATDSAEMPGHKALHHNNILILEGLDLTNAPDDLYELVAFPLKIEGGDGSPVRAVLRRD